MKFILPVIFALALVGFGSKPFYPMFQRNHSSLTSETWTGDEKPYNDVRARIKAEYKLGGNLATIAQKYKMNALKNSRDPVAQFAWVYAARGAAIVAGDEDQKAFSLLKTLEMADPGNIHEYADYRFCMSDEANTPLPSKEVEAVGKRLLRYDPKDNWVRLSLINMLCNSKQELVAALPYGQEWVKQEPSNAEAHSALALIYFDQWEKSGRNNFVCGNRAIAEYQSYLRLAKPDASFRTPAETYIRYIQQAQAHKR